jgi:hypothetical protein
VEVLETINRYQCPQYRAILSEIRAAVRLEHPMDGVEKMWETEKMMECADVFYTLRHTQNTKSVLDQKLKEAELLDNLIKTFKP